MVVEVRRSRPCKKDQGPEKKSLLDNYTRDIIVMMMMKETTTIKLYNDECPHNPVYGNNRNNKTV